VELTQMYGRVDLWVRHEFKLDCSWILRQTQGTQDYQRKGTSSVISSIVWQA